MKPGSSSIYGDCASQWCEDWYTEVLWLMAHHIVQETSFSPLNKSTTDNPGADWIAARSAIKVACRKAYRGPYGNPFTSTTTSTSVLYQQPGALSRIISSKLDTWSCGSDAMEVFEVGTKIFLLCPLAPVNTRESPNRGQLCHQWTHKALSAAPLLALPTHCQHPLTWPIYPHAYTMPKFSWNCV